MAVTIIADDLTGACDAGALFGGRGPSAFSSRPSCRTIGGPPLRWTARVARFRRPTPRRG